MRKHAWLITNVALGALTVVAGYFVIAYRQDIQDWWTLQRYVAPAAIKQLADDGTMTDHARNVFYVSDPRVEDSENFNLHCSRTGEKSLVLGCYTSQRIYVYNVTDARLAGVKQVTAAHEMLHAAYERLDADAKERLNAMLESALPKVTDERLKELIKLYNEAEPGELLNEMHSILGTEYGSLSPELETYYKQYFGDRSKIVAYANSYESIFSASKARLAQLETQLEELKKQIDTNTNTITTQKDALDAKAQELNTLRSTDTAAYNKAVPGYNNQVRAYNNLVIAARDLIETYNALVVEHNNEAAAQNDLYHSLDSRYQTVAN